MNTRPHYAIQSLRTLFIVFVGLTLQEALGRIAGQHEFRVINMRRF